MNSIIVCSAWIAIALALLTLFYYPFLIGKPKEGDYTGLGFLAACIESFIFVVLAGRVLGWW